MKNATKYLEEKYDKVFSIAIFVMIKRYPEILSSKENIHNFLLDYINN